MPTSYFNESVERYAAIGVDVEKVLGVIAKVPISMHCLQGDDVGGFESPDATIGSGLAVTGNYPGKARTIDELRQDIETATRLIPGQHRLNLHAIYGDFSSGKADRNVIGTRATQKALLLALLSPNERLKEMELAGDYSGRLALMEDARMLPAGAVWEEFCRRSDTAGDLKWLDEVRAYESEVLSNR